MADIIRIAERLAETRRSPSEPRIAVGARAEILLFTGIRYERLETSGSWTRVELPTLPSLPAPA